jgi:hypothetical protein
MLRRVTLEKADVSEERVASIIRVIRIGELGTTLAITIVFLCTVRRLLVTTNIVPSSPILVTLMMVIRSSEMSVLTRVIWRNNPEDGILQHLRLSRL